MFKKVLATSLFVAYLYKNLCGIEPDFYLSFIVKDFLNLIPIDFSFTLYKRQRA